MHRARINVTETVRMPCNDVGDSGGGTGNGGRNDTSLKITETI